MQSYPASNPNLSNFAPVYSQTQSVRPPNPIQQNSAPSVPPLEFARREAPQLSVSLTQRPNFSESTLPRST